MASKIKLSNANGKIVTIENNDSNMSDVTLNGASITKKVDTLANMRAMNELPETVWCSGYHSKNDGVFGSHFYRLKGLKTTEIDNGGTAIVVSVGDSDYVYELQYSGAVNVKWFGAKGDGVTDDTTAILVALRDYKEIEIPKGDFVMKAPMLLEGHSVKSSATPGAYYGSVRSVSRVLFSGFSGTAVVNQRAQSEIVGVWFEQSDWLTEMDGFRPERTTNLTDCVFTEFNGMGSVLRASADTPTISPYYTVFTRCQFLFNAKHGVAIVNGGNAITLTDCRSMWNGSPSKGVQPTAPSDWDGLYLNGKDPNYPPSYTTFEPQVILVTGGDYSYNSRYGQNWERAYDSVLIGGYIENNHVTDLCIRSIYGCVVSNPMTMKSPDIATVAVDPNIPANDLRTFPNHIIVRGQNFGDGYKPSWSNRRNQIMPAFYTSGSEAAVSMYPTPTGAVVFKATSAQSVTFEPTLATKIAKVRIGESAFSLGNWEAGSYLGASSTDEGATHITMMSTGRKGFLSVANGGGHSVTGCFLGAPKNSVTGRSINTGGTVNTVGADYAEYEPNGGLVIPKGSIVGFNSDGVLTLNFDDSVRFGIKSTNPSFVGGDTWANFLPEQPTLRGQAEDEEDAHYKEVERKYTTDLSTWKESFEELRGGVDRIAYSGKVPVNVYGSSPSDYVIPTRGPDGEIIGVCVAEPTLTQYLKSVGRVNRVLDDGRAEVAVIVH